MAAAKNNHTMMALLLVYSGYLFVMVGPMFLFGLSARQPFLDKAISLIFLFSLLPMAIVSIWQKRIGGIWIATISCIMALNLWAQAIRNYQKDRIVAALVASCIWWALVTLLPAFAGWRVAQAKTD
jgi:hypothetical protein